MAISSMSAILLMLVAMGAWPGSVEASTRAAGNYTPDWDSLDSRPLPAWFDEAKVGIFMHFGPYAVPAFSSEWFWNSWKNNHPDVVKFMSDNYPPKTTYQDFGPQLRTAFFDAAQLADLVESSGAKYLVFTSKHHDGFTNWPSPYTYGWNSVDVGPQRDIVGELKQAFQKYPDIHFGLYYSLFEWYNPLYLRDQASGFKTREFVLNKMMPEIKDLITKYSPEVLWSDGDWEATPEYFGSQEILAWMYNEGPTKDTIVTNDRWGQGTMLKHGGYYSGPDKFQPGHALDHKFESCESVDAKSWGNRRDMHLSDVLEPEKLISLIASIVSCNGNVLVNVGPNRDGIVQPIFEERLKQMGGWLKVNGEAIYATRPWKHQNDSLSADPQVWYTSKGDVVYAIALGWPAGSTLTLGDVVVDQGSKVTMLGNGDAQLEVKSDQQSVSIHFPDMADFVSRCGKFCQWGYALKLQGVKPRMERQRPNHLLRGPKADVGQAQVQQV